MFEIERVDDSEKLNIFFLLFFAILNFLGLGDDENSVTCRQAVR